MGRPNQLKNSGGRSPHAHRGKKFPACCNLIGRKRSNSERRRGDGLGRSETARGLLATDHVILNHGQVTWTTPELAPPLLTTTPHQREDVSR
ncbi:hypothetical protein TNCV_4218891 [Trichonephila clavipes]|nr:hypothetical protein TNCV_4218891 [Trichonephila clavipes]